MKIIFKKASELIFKKISVFGSQVPQPRLFSSLQNKCCLGNTFKIGVIRKKNKEIEGVVQEKKPSLFLSLHQGR